MGYELRIRNVDGTSLVGIVPVSEIDDPTHDAVLEDYGHLLSGFSTAAFQVSLHSQHVDSLLAPPLLRRQVQIVKDGTIVWWGRLISRSKQGGFWRYQCYSLLWDLYRRNFGPVAANLLTDGDMEAWPSGWTAVNCTAEATSEWRMLGTQSVRVRAAAYDLNAYIQQIVPVTTFPDLGIAFTLAAWYQLDDDDGWLGSAFEDRGILLARSDDGGATLHEDFIDIHTITEETPKGSPQRGEVEVLIPKATSCHLVNRLYAPGFATGWARWDAASLTIPESVSTNPLGSDVFDLIGAMLIHAQNKHWLGLGLAGAATGTTVIESHQFSEGGNIGEAITSFSRDGTADVDIRWNDAGTDKWLHVYGGGKHNYRSEFEFTDGGNGTVAQIVEWDEDGEEVTTSPRFHGSGDGSDREYGIYTDASQLDGLILESVNNAPPEAPISALYGLARQEWERASRPVVKGTLVCRLDVVDGLEVGDTVPASLAEVGFLDDVRIYSIQVNVKSGMAEIGVNRAA